MARIDKIAKNFDPTTREKVLYQAWMDAESFVPKEDPQAESYCVIMPPPNITGQLHIGHSLDLGVQDILVRQKRMQGFATLYLPGTDHASIATEARIVAAMREEGLTKESVGYEGFMERAWAWKQAVGGQIEDQIRSMGISCDWSRMRFTMDEGVSKAVRKVFVSLYEQGYLYRGERMINWCPDCATSISDAEVEHKERQDQLYHCRYPFSDGSGELLVATTRPETLFGDLAVAVHPEDARYQAMIGKTVHLPLTDRHIPIIADGFVDPDFGSGAVKITPSHDPNDFDCGQRHGLGLLEVLTDDAKLNEKAGRFAGMDIEAGRQAVVAALEAEGFLVKKEDYPHSVGCCYRCDHVIEPKVSLQWFVAMKELAEPAIEAVRSGKIRFVPERFDKPYFHWMENTQDWCVSRQLWWGHPIPVWYCDACDEITVSMEDPDACAHCQSSELRRDPDTLDTWFSSALWPFSTLGWPEKTAAFERFYPTNALVTGYDIITFWVSRMIFSALHHTQEIPFQDVVIHGLVRDPEGKKMSKSSGNGVDPLEIIATRGSDALRYALTLGTSPGNDLRYSETKLEAGRNFANKLWNAFRFTVMNFDETMDFDQITVADLEPVDAWILGELQSLIREVTSHFAQYELGMALGKINHFLWDLFCDWYIEMVKERLRSTGKRRQVAQYVLNKVLIDSVKLLHPFMPFLTEEIFGHLIHEEGLLVTAAWPVADAGLDFAEEKRHIQDLMDVVRGIRNLRAELKVPSRQQARIVLLPQDAEAGTFLKERLPILQHLAEVSRVDLVASQEEVPVGAVAVVYRAGTAFLPLAELIDLEVECARLEAEVRRLQKEMAGVQGKLDNAQFLAKAPAAVVAKEREKYEAYAKLAAQNEKRAEEMRKAFAEQERSQAD